MNRCQWASATPLEQRYHDKEWGVPLHNDRRLFEFLILEGAQAGLSWSTILNKRAGYRQAFDRFDPEKIARYSEKKIAALLLNPAIIRNRLKVTATITNARAFLKVQAEFGSFNTYIWRFVDDTPIQNNWENMAQVPASTSLSNTMSKDLKTRGFRFVGPTICYAFMQAVGMVNDHTIDCYRHDSITQLETTKPPLSDLMNIGETIEKRLHEIGIFSKKDLSERGPAEAYRQIRQNYPGESLPLCYYLYSLEGALRNVRWNNIGSDRKKELQSGLG